MIRRLLRGLAYIFEPAELPGPAPAREINLRVKREERRLRERL